MFWEDMERDNRNEVTVETVENSLNGLPKFYFFVT